MTLKATRKLDFFSIGPANSVAILSLVDEEDWSDPKSHLLLLQEKLNAYFEFIESGQIWRQLQTETGSDKTTSMPIEIRLHSLHPVPGVGQQFLAHVREIVTKRGWALTHHEEQDS